MDSQGCARLRQGRSSSQCPKEFFYLLTSWEQPSNHRVLEASAPKRPLDSQRRELEEEQLIREVLADLISMAVERPVSRDWRQARGSGACRERSAAQAAEASVDQEADLMDIQADHQVALIVPSEAASRSLGADLQAEAAHRLLHPMEDRPRHRLRQADLLQESLGTPAWRRP